MQGSVFGWSDDQRLMILGEKKVHNHLTLVSFPRYALKFPDLDPYVESIRGDCISKRRAQRVRTWEKKADRDFLRAQLNTSLIVHLLENTMGYQSQQPYPQPPPQQAQQPPMPSQQEMWAIIQQQKAALDAAQQQVQEAAKKERLSTYRIRRAKGSGNLSFNWGDTFRGAYLTPSKYQDGRVTIAGASMPATIQLQNTQQGPFIVATIQNGPLNQEEVDLYNEWFVKPVEVIPQRRGRPTGGQATTSAPQQPYAPPPAPPPQQYAPPPQPPTAYYPPPPTAQAPPQPQANALASIAHLPQDLQNTIVKEANTLLTAAPNQFPSLDLAVQAVKRSKNIP